MLRRHDARAVRPNQARLALLLQRLSDADLVLLRDAFRDAHDQANLVLYRINDGVRCERWRDVDDGRVWFAVPYSLLQTSRHMPHQSLVP